jgi:hypothetical protein
MAHSCTLILDSAGAPRDLPAATPGPGRRDPARPDAPQKFNATVTRAWTEIVAHHVAAGPPGTDFDFFADRNPALLDKRLLARHCSARVLAASAARTGWVDPDRTPFPWTA